MTHYLRVSYLRAGGRLYPAGTAVEVDASALSRVYAHPGEQWCRVVGAYREGPLLVDDGDLLDTPPESTPEQAASSPLPAAGDPPTGQMELPW